MIWNGEEKRRGRCLMPATYSIKEEEDVAMQQKKPSMNNNNSSKNKKIKITTHRKEEDEGDGGGDRISQLPDDVLCHILHLIPLKCAVSTSILSNRWKELWQHLWAHTTALDFGTEFASNTDLSLLSRTINRFLLLHRSNTINIFRLYFFADDLFRADIDTWVKFAVEKKVKQLDLHLFPCTLERITRPISLKYKMYTLPPCLFSSDTLTILTLHYCDLNLPSGCMGFGSLKTLNLDRVHITQCTLEMVLHKCPMLEELSLLGCYGLRSDLLLSGTKSTDLKIKTFKQIRCYGRDNAGFLVSKLAHLQMLTMCHFNIYQLPLYPEIYSITLPNLRELQYGVGDPCGLADLYSLFRVWNFPCLETLMIEWIPNSEPRNNWVMKSSGVFHLLKTIKMNGFYGSESQMHVVKFLLLKAIVLETMVLVTPREVTEGCIGKRSVYKAKLNMASLSSLHEQLTLMPKGSTKAQAVLYEHAEDDNSSLAT